MTEELNTEHRTPNTEHRSFRSALAWMLALSVVLGWLPVLGPFAAGVVGGRRVRNAGAAFFAALIAAALWIGLLIWASQHEFKIGEQTTVLGALSLFAPVTAAALIGGALVGSGVTGAALAGAVVLAGSLVWFVPKARDVWNVIKQIQGARTSYRPVENRTCPDNLSKLYAAVMNYAESWDETLPPADRWMTALTDKTQPFAQEEWLHCPQVSRPKEANFGYAMNDRLGGKRLEEIKDKANTPLFYDSTDLKMDAHDNVATLPKSGRHTGLNNIVYADGRVKPVAPQ